jgi:hypothetical protein
MTSMPVFAAGAEALIHSVEESTADHGERRP